VWWWKHAVSQSSTSLAVATSLAMKTNKEWASFKSLIRGDGYFPETLKNSHRTQYNAEKLAG
jgi:hypothetical protein